MIKGRRRESRKVVNFHFVQSNPKGLDNLFVFEITPWMISFHTQELGCHFAVLLGST